MAEGGEARADWWRDEWAGQGPDAGAEARSSDDGGAASRTLLPVPAGLFAPERAAGSPDGSRATLALVNAVGPTLLLVLGGALGVATQMSDSGSMSLRVPSLFAALFMVAQGLFELDRMHRTRLADRASEAVDAGHQQRGGHSGPAAAAAGPSAQARMSIPVVLMVLAAWLGLAVLRGAGGADVVLETLATLSAFLLFAIGWQVLLGSR